MSSDDNYTPMDKKRAFLSTWTGKAIALGTSSALIGGGYYYLETSKQVAPSESVVLTPKTILRAKKVLGDQTNLQTAMENDICNQRPAINSTA